MGNCLRSSCVANIIGKRHASSVSSKSLCTNLLALSALVAGGTLAMTATCGQFISSGCCVRLLFAPVGAHRGREAPRQSSSAGGPMFPGLSGNSTPTHISRRSVTRGFSTDYPLIARNSVGNPSDETLTTVSPLFIFTPMMARPL